MTDLITLSRESATQLSMAILRQSGLADDQAAAVTDVIIRGQCDECHSHGLYRLLGSAHSVRSGVVNAQARPRVTDLSPAIVRVDADHGFSPLAYAAGIGHLKEKTRKLGIAAMAVVNCHHFSALWPELEPLAREGLAALALTPSHAWVAPAGGTKPVFGTNPVAFAWPRPGRDPFVFDFATSATARGEIELHRRSGTPLPEGLAIDRDGRPTQDAEEALEGAMLAFGGHKGSALSAMVELLGGAVIGDFISLQSKEFDAGRNAAPLHGELIIAFDPAVFLGPALAENLARAEILFEAIVGQGARLPSERRYAARKRTAREGLTVPRKLHDELLGLAGPEYLSTQVRQNTVAR